MRNPPATIPEPPIKPRLAFTEAEAARLLGVSARTLYQLRREGRIGYLPVGTRIVYPAVALREFVRKNTVKATAEAEELLSV